MNMSDVSKIHSGVNFLACISYRGVSINSSSSIAVQHCWLAVRVAHNHSAGHQITADRNCCLFTKLEMRRDDSEYIYIKL
jgi:hypothetical protein